MLVDDPGDLIALLPPGSPLAWMHRGQGLVAWGEVARLDSRGPGRFREADTWWRDLSARSIVRDEARIPGSGLVAFGSFAYADVPGASVLVVPEVVVGRRGSTCWVTTIGRGSVSPRTAADAHRATAASRPAPSSRMAR